jgi:hypothetical protein
MPKRLTERFLLYGKEGAEDPEGQRWTASLHSLAEQFAEGYIQEHAYHRGGIAGPRGSDLRTPVPTHQFRASAKKVSAMPSIPDFRR